MFFKSYQEIIFFVLLFFPFFSFSFSPIIPGANVQLQKNSQQLQQITEYFALFLEKIQAALEKNSELWGRMSQEMCAIEAFQDEYDPEPFNKSFELLIKYVDEIRAKAEKNSHELRLISQMFAKIIEDEKKRAEVLSVVCDLF